MQEVTKIEKSLKKEIQHATDFKCISKSDFEDGGRLLKLFKQAEKQAKELKDKALQPSLETTKQIREYFRPLENNLMACIRNVKDSMDAWHRAEQERIEKQKAKVLTDARISKDETRERKIEEIEASTATGNTRRVRVLKITNIARIPAKYFDLNEARVKADLLEGIDVPGAELVNETKIVA